MMMKISNLPAVIWITGLPCSGKTTIGAGIYQILKEKGMRAEHLDGDEIRKIFPDTGFSREERDRHIRRIGYLASMLERHGIFVVASFISPYKESRRFVRSMCNRFIEVYLSTPLSVCEKRDTKGLYARSRLGQIKGFTGIDDPFEIPSVPELIIDTSVLNIEESISLIIRYVFNINRQ